MTSQPGRRRGAAIPADRAAVVGLRQLRDALQGVRPEGRAARPVREGRRRRPGPPLHRRRADASRSTSRGTRSTTTPTSPATPPTVGVALGTINSNVFQDDDYMLGSVCNPDAARPAEGARPPARLHRHHGRDRLARPQAVVLRRDELPRPGRHPRPPGPAGRGARRRPRPARRRTSGWSSSTSSSSRRSTRWTCPTGGPPTSSASPPGPRRKVVVDTGHHAPGTNIEFIVASLLRADRLGGFDFNSRFYADDDLMVGVGRPVPAVPDHARGRPGGRASTPDLGVAFMLDQCHNIEPKIPGQIRSVMNVQEATAKALLVDADGARPRRRPRGDVLGANAVLMDAYDTDVRPLLAEVRTGLGPRSRPDGRLRPVRLRASGSSPSGSAASRPGWGA